MAWRTHCFVGLVLGVLALRTMPAEAACPVGAVTGNVTLSPGDNCTAGLQAGAGGIITGSGVTVPFSEGAATAAASATGGGIINLSSSSLTGSNLAAGAQASGSGWRRKSSSPIMTPAGSSPTANWPRP